MIRLALTVLAIIGISLSMRNLALTAQDTVKSSLGQCPDQITTEGSYKNWDFGFKVTIPPKLKGSWNSANCIYDHNEGCICMPDHGRIIPLSGSQGFIEIYAGFSGSSLGGAVNSRLDDMYTKYGKERVKVTSSSTLILAGLPARRVLVTYYAQEAGKWWVEDFVQAKRKNIEYTIYLRTEKEAFRKHRSAFEAILKSFKLTRAGQL